MLLSSVALVSKPKNIKYKDGSDKKVYRRTDTGVQRECEQCRKEMEEEASIFKFPTTPEKGTADLGQAFNKNRGDRVTIVTGDALCLSVEMFYYTITLREEAMSDSTCIFRKKVLDTKTMPNGHVETVVFALDCDQDFYLTSSSKGDLELNYLASTPKVDQPDERVFDVFFTNLGHVLIQPKLINNNYLHHIDQALSVQQFDLNWRCPEEYFFHFNAVPEPVEHQQALKKRVCTHDKDNLVCAERNSSGMEIGCSHLENLRNIAESKVEQIDQLSNKLMIELPTRKPKKHTNPLSSLFLGCFSSRSHTLAMS